MAHIYKTALEEVGRVKQIQDAILAPYLDNTEDIDVIDFTRIMVAIGFMPKLSTQTIQDVIDELQGTLDDRP